MTRILVAAGGGGDALAAAIIHAATADPYKRPVILTYAWDRLLIDPLPGPRGPESFTGLGALTPGNATITPDTRPVSPSGSTLPRLASDLDATLVLIDPAAGASGIRAQLDELIWLLDAQRIDIVDVGGDAIAHGDEPGLRSPLADGLVLAACTGLAVPVDLLTAGPGLDGELDQNYVISRAGELALRLGVSHVMPFENALAWHPSEATAILAAAARGARGIVEVRDSGLPVRMTEYSSRVYRLSHDQAVAESLLVPQLIDTRSLDEAEDVVRHVCGSSEIDYERAKAARRSRGTRAAIDLPAIENRLRQFEAEAQARAVDYVTFRRLAEALGLTSEDTDCFEHI